MTSRRAVLGFLATSPVLAAGAALAPGDALVVAARRQIGITTGFDQGYRRIAYPWGDPPRSTGVCADVVIRAVRDAWRLDLQQLVHVDMSRDFSAYPKRWGLRSPDSNIDHRRVPNLETYWTRHGAQVWRAAKPNLGFAGPLQPGDILTWRAFLGCGPHVALLSQGGLWPKIIQNFGEGVREYPLAPFLTGAGGHYRWRPV